MQAKTLLLVINLLCISFLAQAQENRIAWGPEYKLASNFERGFLLLGIVGDYYYVVDDRYEENKLLQYDLKHKLVSEKTLDLMGSGEPLLLKNLVQTPSGNYAYFLQYDEKGKEMLSLKSTFKNGEFSEVTEVSRFPFEAGPMSIGGDLQESILRAKTFQRPNGLPTPAGADDITLSEIDTYRKEELIQSADQQKSGQVLGTALLEGHAGGKADKNQQVLALVVFDEQLNLLWQKNWVSTEKNRIDVVDRAVANDGSLYVLGRVEDKNKGKFLPQNKYILYRFTKDSETAAELSLDNEELGITTVGLFIQEQGTSHRVFVSGFYTDNQKKSGELGLFTAFYDNQLKRSALKFNEFDKSITGWYLKEKDLDKGLGLGEGSTYRMKQFFEWSDQSISFIAGFHGGDFMIPKFTREGELVKIRLVKRYFYATIPNLRHYRYDFASTFKNDKLYLMYNDFLSDEEWKALKAKKSEDYADFTVLNKDLEIIYNKPIHQEEARKPDFFIPTFSAASDDYLLILRTNGTRNYRLGTIPLK